MLSKDYSAEALGAADRRAGEDARGDRQSTCGSGCCDAVLTAGYGSIPVTAKPSGNILTVGVEYGVDYHASARFGRRHDVDRHSLRERPAHHYAAVQADYRERAQHPLAGPQIRNVVHELVGWRSRARSGRDPAFGSEMAARFPALCAQPRSPSSRRQFCAHLFTVLEFGAGSENRIPSQNEEQPRRLSRAFNLGIAKRGVYLGRRVSIPRTQARNAPYRFRY